MDGTKTVRRRANDHEFSENNQFKRKRKREIETDTTDSVEILGESHVVFPSKNNVNTHYWSQNTSRNNDTKCYFSNGIYGESERVENIQNHKSSHKHNNAPNSSGKRYVSGQQNGRAKEKISNCTGERTAGAHSSSFPSLPPSLRESERMMNVQRWINSIPSDLPSWIQVSHDKIIPVKNPHQCFSEIEDPSVYEHADSLDPALHNDILDGSSNTIVDNVHREVNSTGQNMKYFDKRNNHSSKPTQATTSLALNHRGVSTGTHGVQPPPPPPPPAIPSQLSSSAQHGSTSNMNTSLGLVGSHFPNVSSGGNSMNSHRNLLTPMKNYQSNQEIGISNHNQSHHLPYCIESDPNEGNYSSRHRVECETNNDYQNNNNNNSNNTQQNQTGGGSVKSNGRLFSDTEIQMIVKLFQDYFTKGSCPMLKEVRLRIMNNFLESTRTPIGIRAKIKRLQKTGQWTEYITA